MLKVEIAPDDAAGLRISEATLCYRSLVSETGLPRIALSENSQQIAHQQDHEHCANPDARTSARAPPAITVISAAPSENERQNAENDEYGKHFRSPFTPDCRFRGHFIDLTALCVSTSTNPTVLKWLSDS